MGRSEKIEGMKMYFKKSVSNAIAIALLVSIMMNLTLMQTFLVQAQTEEIPRDEALVISRGSKFSAVGVFNPLTTNQGGESPIFTYDDLFYRNLMNGSIIPWIGLSYTYDPGFTGLTLNLRQGVYWSDGQPFTAADVKFTYDLCMSNYSIFLTQGGSWVKENIASTTIVDSYTVHFEFTAPNARADYFMFTSLWPVPKIVPKHIWENVNPITFTNYPNPVVSGPYTIISWTEERMVLKRQDNYWAKDLLGVYPASKYIIYLAGLPTDQVMISLAANDIDVVWMLTKSQSDYITGANALCQSWEFSDNYINNLAMNWMYYPLNMTEFRWAICLAIDKQRVNGAVYEGAGIIARTPMPELPGLAPYIFPDVLSKYDVTEYNVTKANEILDSLGFYKGSDGIRVTPNGTRLSYIVYTNPNPGMLEGAMVMADSLRAVGIDATPRVLDWSIHNGILRRGEWQLIFKWIAGAGHSNAFDPYGVYIATAGWDWRPLGTPSPTNDANPERYRNATFDEIITNLGRLSLTDPAAIPYYRKALEIYLEDLISIPIVSVPTTVVFNTKYWTNWPSAENPYTYPITIYDAFLLAVFRIKSTATGYIKISTMPITGQIFVNNKLVNVGTAEITPVIGATIHISFGNVEGYVTPGNLSIIAETGMTSTNPQLVTGNYVAETPTELIDLNVAVNGLASQLTTVTGQLGTLTIVIAIEAIGLVVLAVALAFTLKRK